MIIGIIGYGKMGQAVEKQALARDHSFALLSSLDPPRSHGFESIDCVIDFSHESVAENAISTCLRAGVPVVSGTTGWNDRIDSVRKLCDDIGGAFCWSPNFSIGMQITFHINRLLAAIMNDHLQYAPDILEVHHTAKKDAPSGTAIALANDIIHALDRIETSRLQNAGNDPPPGVIPIKALRESDVTGIHRVVYKSDVDTLSIRHHALSRRGFADGAVLAAERLVGKKGNFSFKDLLNLSGTS